MNGWMAGGCWAGLGVLIEFAQSEPQLLCSMCGLSVDGNRTVQAADDSHGNLALCWLAWHGNNVYTGRTRTWRGWVDDVLKAELMVIMALIKFNCWCDILFHCNLARLFPFDFVIPIKRGAEHSTSSAFIGNLYVG